MDLAAIADLWNYQHSEARLTNYLKDKIQGYDNGRVYNVETAKKERAESVESIKFGRKDVDSEL